MFRMFLSVDLSYQIQITLRPRQDRLMNPSDQHRHQSGHDYYHTDQHFLPTLPSTSFRYLYEVILHETDQIKHFLNMNSNDENLSQERRGKQDFSKLLHELFEVQDRFEQKCHDQNRRSPGEHRNYPPGVDLMQFVET
uniref:Uncharacterized protein n=2 Tax=Cacopsylla melanoneura TaxID=428564 RepID=A0A8D8PS64_9HEMI